MTDRVRLDIRDEVAYVTMVRTDKYNALDWEMLCGLVDAADRIASDKSIRAVILSGEGKAFCSGLDFPSFTKQPMRMVRGFLKYGVKTTNLFQEVAWCWRRLPVPVIAVLHGYCYGGGLQIALAADFRFSTPDCEFSILEAKWGLVPDMTGTVTLRELLPMDKAKLLTMTGRMFSGEEALRLNLVTETGADPLAAAEALVAEIKSRSPDAVAATKQLFQETWVAGVRRAFSRESRIQLGLLLGKNQKIATEANFKKKKAEFLPRK
ncbi:MAG: phaB [Moraxellaceae bacterium]|jgi:enoyl-CoA hydratase/carnithine racemase|nr:phaB [Moraxellaceae bacterium]